ncbi:unnamed protein product [Citrullus colocynthis]|uniref:Ycf15 n=1 Tax=Citrullus colocynthis TaxID=252529 RepID=A0ABP0Z074_9ROSI
MYKEQDWGWLLRPSRDVHFLHVGIPHLAIRYKPFGFRFDKKERSDRSNRSFISISSLKDTPPAPAGV